MKQYVNKSQRHHFTRRLTRQEILLGLLVLLPAFLVFMSYISSALIKFYYLNFNPHGSYLEAVTILNFINDFLMVLIGVLILHDFLKIQGKDFLKHWSHILLYGVFVGYFLNYGGNIVGSLIVRLFSTTTTSVNQNTIVTMAKSYPMIMLVTTSLLAPIAEELVFRGFLFTWLRKYHVVLGYFVSAFLFGFVHVMSSVFSGNVAEMIQMVPYMISGLVFAYIYEHENNIFASIGTHIANNAIAMIIVLLIS